MHLHILFFCSCSDVFINRGVVEVVSEDGAVVYATMDKGKFFGEIGVILGTPRTASIRYLALLNTMYRV